MSKLLNKKTFALTLFLSVLVSSVAFGAKVTKIRKKQGYVYINQGVSSGFKSSEPVCFYPKNSSKRVACGKVAKAKKKSAIVRVSKKRIKRVKKGYTAKLNSKEAQAQRRKSSGSSLKIVLFTNLGIVPTFTYNNLDWWPALEVTEGTNWFGTQAGGNLTINLGGELQLPKMGFSVGGKVNISGYAANSSDYPLGANPGDSNRVLTSTTPGLTVGVYLDYYLFKFGDLDLGLGLDFTMTNIEVSAEQSNLEAGGQDQALNYPASLNILSLRVPSRYTLRLGNLGLVAGVDLLVPLPLFEGSGEPEISEHPSGIALIDGEDFSYSEDLKKSLALSAGSFALDLIVGASYEF